MTGRAHSISMLEHALALRAERRFAHLRDLLAPSAVYELAGDRRLMPYAGVFRGAMDISVALDAFDIEFEIHDLTIGHVLGEPGAAGARWSACFVNRGSRDSARVRGFTHMRFAQGLVCDWADYIDTATASYLAGWMPEMPAYAMSGPAGR